MRYSTRTNQVGEKDEPRDWEKGSTWIFSKQRAATPNTISSKPTRRKRESSEDDDSLLVLLQKPRLARPGNRCCRRPCFDIASIAPCVGVSPIWHVPFKSINRLYLCIFITSALVANVEVDKSAVAAFLYRKMRAGITSRSEHWFAGAAQDMVVRWEKVLLTEFLTLHLIRRKEVRAFGPFGVKRSKVSMWGALKPESAYKCQSWGETNRS